MPLKPTFSIDLLLKTLFCLAGISLCFFYLRFEASQWSFHLSPTPRLGASGRKSSRPSPDRCKNMWQP